MAKLLPYDEVCLEYQPASWREDCRVNLEDMHCPSTADDPVICRRQIKMHLYVHIFTFLRSLKGDHHRTFFLQF